MTKKSTRKTTRAVKETLHSDAPHESFAGDAEAFAAHMAEATALLAQATQLILSSPAPVSMGHTDPLALAETLISMTRHARIDTDKLLTQQFGLAADYCDLWHRTSEALLGKQGSGGVNASPRDRRFKDEAWNHSTVYDFIKQSYLINAQWMERSLSCIDGLDAHTSRKVNFFTRQLIDALSPSNSLFFNPEVVRATLESNGENLVRGLKNLVSDLKKGAGRLKISMTDEQAFTLGETIATSKGAIVYENELMQLIQYKAATETVHEIPVLITPAWINKYYVLDLRPENSLVAWLTAQGYTVFVISWVNPNAELGRKRFDDYLASGPLKALDVISDITKCARVNVVGYCLGGTLTSIMLSVLHSRGQAARVASATYLTTMVDFAEAGDLSVFIDDIQLNALEERMSEQGYLESSDMANTFNMLRANDLIWSFVINNYLLGKDPFPFDLLYWNSDSTRMPATMHSFYLRNMYQQNLLVKPGGIEILGEPINLARIRTPSYILSTREDHIAPWQSTYAATQLYEGPVQFTLADSGHIAGVINPPGGKKKYGYAVNKALPSKASSWLETATSYNGSWWEHWDKWMQPYQGKKVASRALGSKRHKVIESAPGRYATVRT
jgi:polyhydroxyalkanoate synthase subunit PhaC